jgi:hypothetical protein
MGAKPLTVDAGSALVLFALLAGGISGTVTIAQAYFGVWGFVLAVGTLLGLLIALEKERKMVIY